MGLAIERLFLWLQQTNYYIITMHNFSLEATEDTEWKALLIIAEEFLMNGQTR